MKIIPFALSFLLLSYITCKKQEDSTVLDLTVVDYFSAEPLEGVDYAVAGVFYNKKRSDGTYPANFYLSGQTKADGKINLVFSPGESPQLNFFTKAGYLWKFAADTPIKSGEYNDFLIRLRPFDATIKLEVKSNLNTKDSLYFIVRNSTFIKALRYPTGHTLGLPITIAPEATTVFYIPSIAEEALSFYRSWENIDIDHLPPPKDIITIPKGDTLVYFISN